MQKDILKPRNRVLVIGKTSFIATALQQSVASANFTAINARTALDDVDFGAHDIVINCALDPQFKKRIYEESLDIDLRIARLAAKAGTHFVMLSSRKVYGEQLNTEKILVEHATQPDSLYGSNKLESEQRIRTELEEQHTILRVGNVFGFELGRPSFLGMALTSLKNEQRVILDVSPFVERDFIPVHIFCDILVKIFDVKPVGTFNIGSGIGYALGCAGMRLIDGYGTGRLVITRTDARDPFVLDISRLRDRLNISWPNIDFDQEFISLGRQLQHA